MSRRKLAWLIGLPVLLMLAYKAFNAWYMVGYVPEKFGLRLPYSEGACFNDLFSYTGAFSVGLDIGTIRAIQAEGIAFFDGVGAPRAEGRRISFHDWKATPAPEAASPDGIAANFGCGALHGWFFPGGVRQALQQPGSFYSNDLSGRSAVVIPAKGVIIVSMQSR